MKLLVTGVAGFIASSMADMLLAQGQAVVRVDNFNDYYDVRVKRHRLDGWRNVSVERQSEGSLNRPLPNGRSSS